MKIRHLGPTRKAEQRANRVAVPLIRSLRLGDFVQRTVAQSRDDHLSAAAGNIAYRALFASFPSLISLLWLLKVLHATVLVAALVQVASLTVPKAAGGVIRDQLTQTPPGHERGDLTFAALVSLIVAIWAISAAVRAMMEAMNGIYGVEEGRPLWQRYLVSLLLALALGGLLLGALILIVFGSRIANALGQHVGLGVGLHWLWTGAIWAAVLFGVLSAFALAYYFAPDVRQRFRWVTLGSVVAVGLWLVYSVLFSLYVNRFEAPTETYGALAGIAVLMIYCYGAVSILLLGAEMNRVVEQNQLEEKHPGERVREGDHAPVPMSR